MQTRDHNPHQKLSRRAWWLGSLLAVVGGSGLLFAGSWVSKAPILCVFRRATGTPCPACGLTRALAAAFQGNLEAAHRLHPLWPGILATAAILWFAWSLDTWWGTQLLERLALPVVGALLLLLSGLWLVRFFQGALPV